jgi:hypothetical protein
MAIECHAKTRRRKENKKTNCFLFFAPSRLCVTLNRIIREHQEVESEAARQDVRPRRLDPARDPRLAAAAMQERLRGSEVVAASRC